MVYPTVLPFVQPALLVNVHCNELLGWLDLWLHHPYWTLPEIPLRYPGVALSHRNLWLRIYRVGPFTCPSSVETE